MIHTGTSVFPGARNAYADPMPADDIGVDFPKLRVILAHAGRPLHGETALFLVRRHPNFFLDLSASRRSGCSSTCRGSPRSPIAAVGIRLPSPGVADVRKNVDDFLALELPEAARRAILWDNAARIF
jgi:predicted TIM-barrel fold metal-dependent hydrolase